MFKSFRLTRFSWPLTVFMAALWNTILDFHRSWQVERVIDDRHGGSAMSFSGEINTRLDKDALIWTETGQLTTPAGAFQAERINLWRDTSRGIEVLFQNGDPFHQIERSQNPSASHPCAPDSYELRYNFRDWPNWSLEVEVKGPRKDYTPLSRFG